MFLLMFVEGGLVVLDYNYVIWYVELHHGD